MAKTVEGFYALIKRRRISTTALEELIKLLMQKLREEQADRIDVVFLESAVNGRFRFDPPS